MKHRFRAVRAFGWQLDYRPDGWLPLDVREGTETGWHVLPLGRLGCVTLGRIRKPGTLTVTLTADTTAFVAAMDQVHEGIQMTRWRRRIRGERLAGRAFVDAELDRMCTDLGMDPEQVWRRPRAREVQASRQVYRSHPWDAA